MQRFTMAAVQCTFESYYLYDLEQATCTYEPPSSHP